jgi:cytochrome c biogenesis protein
MQYEENVHNLGGAILLVIFTPGSAPEGFWLFTEQQAKQGSAHKGAFTVTLKALEKRNYTGIQVNHDPALPVVWTGCALLVIGMVVTFTLRRPPKGKTSEEHGRGR